MLTNKYRKLKSLLLKKLKPEPILQFAKITPNAYTPTKGSPLAAGYDLHSAYDYTILPKDKQLCNIDIQIKCPYGCYGRIAARSGLTLTNFIDVGAGVIDPDYRGNVCVILFNFGNDIFEIKKGDRIAQLILEKNYLPKLKEENILDETPRGIKAFGSTGK